MKTTLVARTSRWQVAIPAAALATALTACVPTAPRLDSQLGMAVSIARARQTATPDASQNDPVKGVDGQAGDAAFDNYRESFMKPQPALWGGVINVGAGRAGSAGITGGR